MDQTRSHTKYFSYDFSLISNTKNPSLLVLFNQCMKSVPIKRIIKQTNKMITLDNDNYDDSSNFFNKSIGFKVDQLIFRFQEEKKKYRSIISYQKGSQSFNSNRSFQNDYFEISKNFYLKGSNIYTRPITRSSKRIEAKEINYFYRRNSTRNKLESLSNSLIQKTAKKTRTNSKDIELSMIEPDLNYSNFNYKKSISRRNFHISQQIPYFAYHQQKQTSNFKRPFHKVKISKMFVCKNAILNNKSRDNSVLINPVRKKIYKHSNLQDKKQLFIHFKIPRPNLISLI